MAVNDKLKGFFIGDCVEAREKAADPLAHSTHLKGIGTYKNAVETPRINVVLATGISRQRCEKVNLGYIDPDMINIADQKGKENEGILAVHHAGETLHRLHSRNVMNVSP